MTSIGKEPIEQNRNDSILVEFGRSKPHVSLGKANRMRLALPRPASPRPATRLPICVALAGYLASGPLACSFRTFSCSRCSFFLEKANLVSISSDESLSSRLSRSQVPNFQIERREKKIKLTYLGQRQMTSLSEKLVRRFVFDSYSSAFCGLF